MKIFLSLSLFVALTLAEPPVYRQQSQNGRNNYYSARQQQRQKVETSADADAGAPYEASGWKPEGPAFELPQREQQQQAGQTVPQQQYGAPQAAPQQQYGAPDTPQKQYEAPAAPQEQYGAPQAAPKQQYRASTLHQQQQQQYRAFAQIQQSGAPGAPEKKYGAPSSSQQYYAAPSASQQGYGVPPQQNYGPSEEATTLQEPSSSDSDESTTLSSGTESQAEPIDSVNELAEEGEVDEQQRESGEYYVALPDGRLQRIKYTSSQDIEAMKYFARIQADNVEPLRGPIYAYKPLEKLEFAPTNLRFTVPEPYVPATPVVAIREPARNAARPVKAASEKLQQGHKQQQRQPLSAEVHYDSPTAIVGLTGANVTPLSSSYSTYNAGNQTPNNEQRYLISF